MEVDAAPPPPLPPPPPQPKRRCFCCGQKYGTRQLTWHLKIFLEQLDAARAAEYAEDLGDDDAGPDGTDMDIDDAAPEGPDAMLDFGEGDAQAFANIDIDFANNHIPPYAEPEHIHEPRQNPPVHIDDWADPASDLDSKPPDEPGDGPDQDPPFEEAPAQPVDAGLDPLYKPDLMDEQVRRLMELELGDLADEEWLDPYNETISNKDENTIRFLATRLRTHFSRQTYEELRHGPCETLRIPSKFIAYRRLRILSGLETCAYDSCVNSCCCFLGKYNDCQVCPFCDEPRYNATGQTQRSFYYSPLIPQLQALFRSPDMLEKLQYRAKCEENPDPDPTIIHDVFDSENYHRLWNTRLNPDSEYRFFDNPEDIALGLATDGFTSFKRRRRGLSTAWPIIFLNYNLHPRFRTRLENIICVGVIPGPKQCKDLNLYLAPALEELLVLQCGIESVKAPPMDSVDGQLVDFVLRAFIIMLFGDIPAVSKLLAMKGHNAMVPCRTCYAWGVLCRLPKNLVYYVPLAYPGEEDGYPPELLLNRSHELFLQHYNALDALANRPGHRKRLAREYGVNDRPVFAHLKSIDLASCAPYDIMHLLFENLVPNMVKHWTGKFKKLDQGTGNYQIPEAVWKKVGALTTVATRTIPRQFVGTLPDIAQDQTLYKAEAYSFWIQYVAPVVLQGRLVEPYYKHFISMREIIIRCVQINISHAEIDELEEMINQWVMDYEQYYYQYDYNRLPACPLMIHALLHIPFYIRKTGPPCTSWVFVMERFCGHLLPAVRNRYQPYRHLDNFVLQCAQMKIVCHTYGLPTLARSTVKWTYEGYERLSTRETRYLDFPDVILGHPVQRRIQVDVQLTNQLTKFFSLLYRMLTPAQRREGIDFDSIVSYGCFRLASDGDRICTAGLVERAKSSGGSPRDNSFIRFTVLPDLNANDPNTLDIPIEEVNYGRVINVYYVEFIHDPANDVRKLFLVVRIKSCRGTNGLDAALPENPLVTYRRLTTPDIFNIETIEAVIGRIEIRDGTWAIIDWSRNGARTQFVDDDDNADD